jgi:hypothetical protein
MPTCPDQPEVRVQFQILPPLLNNIVFIQCASLVLHFCGVVIGEVICCVLSFINAGTGEVVAIVVVGGRYQAIPHMSV